MASITLPAPGTKYGPCEPTCQHVDCAATRKQAAQVCPYCSKPLGFEVFVTDAGDGLAHETCAFDHFAPGKRDTREVSR